MNARGKQAILTIIVAEISFLTNLYFTVAFQPPISTSEIVSSKDKIDRFEYTKSVGMLSNSQEYVPTLGHIKLRAQEMFAKRAYVHQYNNFGLEEDEIVDRFYKFAKLVDDYATF